MVYNEFYWDLLDYNSLYSYSSLGTQVFQNLIVFIQLMNVALVILKIYSWLVAENYWIIC